MVKKIKASASGLGRDISHSDTSKLIFSDGKKLKKKPVPTAEAPAKSTGNEKSSFSSESVNPTTLYLRQIGFQPLLSARDELSLARKIAKGCELSRQKMIESNYI